MKFKKTLLSLILFPISGNTFAICDQERAELAEWSAKFKQLSAASCVAGTVGGYFAIPSWGVSMVPCAILITATANANRIKHKKEENLRRCEAHEEAKVEDAEAQAKAEAAAAAARAAEALAELEKRYPQQDIEHVQINRITMTELYERKIQEFVNDLAAQGWDITDPNVQDLIETTRADMEKERDIQIADFINLMTDRAEAKVYKRKVPDTPITPPGFVESTADRTATTADVEKKPDIRPSDTMDAGQPQRCSTGMSQSSSYKFVTQWKFEAPLERVLEAIEKVERWPQWWKGVVAVQQLEPGDPSGVGCVRRLSWKGALPYRLTFDIRTTRVERSQLIEGKAFGEVEGRGLWTFSYQAPWTLVRYEWEVETNKKWMNWLAPLAKPAFEWNHDVIMRWGGEGLARLLDVNWENL